MRLIDADALRYEPLQKCDRNYRTYNLDDAYEDGYSDAFVDISNAPTIDAVEVVRCKECKHRPVMVWSEVYDDFDVLAPEVDGKEDWRCPCLVEDDPYYSWSPNDNWFCGNGERREDNGDGK